MKKIGVLLVLVLVPLLLVACGVSRVEAMGTGSIMSASKPSRGRPDIATFSFKVSCPEAVGEGSGTVNYTDYGNNFSFRGIVNECVQTMPRNCGEASNESVSECPGTLWAQGKWTSRQSRARGGCFRATATDSPNYPDSIHLHVYGRLDCSGEPTYENNGDLVAGDIVILTWPDD